MRKLFLNISQKYTAWSFWISIIIFALAVPDWDHLLTACNFNSQFYLFIFVRSRLIEFYFVEHKIVWHLQIHKNGINHLLAPSPPLTYQTVWSYFSNPFFKCSTKLLLIKSIITFNRFIRMTFRKYLMHFQLIAIIYGFIVLTWLID